MTNWNSPMTSAPTMRDIMTRYPNPNTCASAPNTVSSSTPCPMDCPFMEIPPPAYSIRRVVETYALFPCRSTRNAL